jgi:DNA repair exonuclease SbcCD ATPase subunit
MTLHVRKLTLSAFRSFRDETTLTLPENGLMLIRGPSGAGKSSLLLGLAHAFGYAPFPRY